MNVTGKYLNGKNNKLKKTEILKTSKKKKIKYI